MLTLYFNQIQKHNLLLMKTAQLLLMNLVIVNRALPLTMEAYNHEETNETSQQFDESLKNAFLKEPKYLVFWSTCYFCFVIVLFVQGKQKLHRVRTQGTLLVVTMKCTNEHINTGQPQLMVNNNGPGNIVLSGAILHTGKTFKRILEIFDSVSISHFSRTF